MVRKSEEWVTHAGFICLEKPQNQCLLTQDHFQHKLPVCPWAAGVTLLSLQGQVPHAQGRMGDQVWAPFPVCWVGDVPGCAVAVWCEVEKPQTIFDPVFRLGHKHSTWECLAESGATYMPWCVPTFHWKKIQVCSVPLQGLDFCRKVIGACGPKGTWATTRPLPTGVTWDTRAWEFRYSLGPVLPQEIKIDSYLSQTWFLKSEPQQSKLNTSTVLILLLDIATLCLDNSSGGHCLHAC